MTNKKNLIMLTVVLYLAIAGFNLASSCATDNRLGAYKTEKLYFEKTNASCSAFSDVKIDNEANIIQGWYNPPEGIRGNKLTIISRVGCEYDEYKIIIPNQGYHKFPIAYGYCGYKVTKSIVEFRKIVNGQTYTSTKNLTAIKDQYGNCYIEYYPKNNYEPYSAVVYFFRKSK